jgi:hypothetical protein
MDRRQADNQIGYVTARVEDLDEKLSFHMTKEEQKIDKLEGRIDGLEAKMDRILEKTQTLKGMFLLLKFLASATFLVFALKFGDIKLAWDIFKGSI